MSLQLLVFIWVPALLWGDVSIPESGICCSHLPLPPEPVIHGTSGGKHLLETRPVQASLNRSISSLQRLLALDFVILIFWASFQCQQKSIQSSGRSHQSIGNESCKRPCQGHQLWGNTGTLFLKLTWCDLLAVWNVNISLCVSFPVPLPTWRKL